MSTWQLVLIGWLASSVTMSLFWFIQRRTGDAGIVDLAWGMGVGTLAVFFCFNSPAGQPGRRVVIATLAMLWALRLSSHLLSRLLKMSEDGRYQTLKKNWGSSAQAKMFGFYQVQAFGCVLFALPMLIAARAEAEFGIADIVGIAIWVVALLGESIADRQLARFRAVSSNQAKVCQTGLWRFSRHPNYFFEWLHWWAYVLLAFSAPWGGLTVVGPLLMLVLILRVTGIPPTEFQALKSRGEAYREYQRTTNTFFPWFPKSNRIVT